MSSENKKCFDCCFFDSELFPVRAFCELRESLLPQKANRVQTFQKEKKMLRRKLYYFDNSQNS